MAYELTLRGMSSIFQGKQWLLLSPGVFHRTLLVEKSLRAFLGMQEERAWQTGPPSKGSSGSLFWGFCAPKLGGKKQIPQIPPWLPT
jgi:hypothetical protein